jgi:hypothetical protein
MLESNANHSGLPTSRRQTGFYVSHLRAAADNFVVRSIDSFIISYSLFVESLLRYYKQRTLLLEGFTYASEMDM